MFVTAGFREVRVERVQREDTIGSFCEYWALIETDMGPPTPGLRHSAPKSIAAQYEGRKSHGYRRSYPMATL